MGMCECVNVQYFRDYSLAGMRPTPNVLSLLRGQCAILQCAVLCRMSSGCCPTSQSGRYCLESDVVRTSVDDVKHVER